MRITTQNIRAMSEPHRQVFEQRGCATHRPHKSPVADLKVSITITAPQSRIALEEAAKTFHGLVLEAMQFKEPNTSSPLAVKLEGA